jgi:hypothetical protein
MPKRKTQPVDRIPAQPDLLLFTSEQGERSSSPTKKETGVRRKGYKKEEVLLLWAQLADMAQIRIILKIRPTNNSGNVKEGHPPGWM